jgi:L-aspartate oxidase
MAGTPGKDLAPRDVVARAVFAEWARDGGSAGLDVRHFASGAFANRFPTIYRVLGEYGLDPEQTPIPVRPATHYHMGGVKVDKAGRSSVSGLWAAGEVACTGLHGANRLASNSLLEAAVCGRLVAEDVAGLSAEVAARETDIRVPASVENGAITEIRAIMNRDVGVVRDEAGLTRAIAALGVLRRKTAGTAAEDSVGLALLMARAAERRKESRGAHFRSDAEPQSEPALHSTSHWDELADA